MLRMPKSARSRWISSLSNVSARVTPASPPATAAYSSGRPTKTKWAPSVVGDDDAVDAALARDPRIGRRDQAFYDKLALPAAADQFDMFPGELIAVADVAHQVFRQHRRPALGVHVLEMRHAVIHHRA